MAFDIEEYDADTSVLAGDDFVEVTRNAGGLDEAVGDY